MGTGNSCLRSNTNNEGVYTVEAVEDGQKASPAKTSHEAQGSEENEVALELAGQLAVQSSSPKSSAGNHATRTGEEPTLDPEVTSNMHFLEPEAVEEMLRVFRRLEKQHGCLELQPLNDGVEVEQLAPVVLDSGVIYWGEWNKHMQRHGRGVEVLNQDFKFLGYFKNNRRNGKGQFIQTSGNVYKGTFKNGKASGKGEYRNADGGVVKGTFENDIVHGVAEETVPDGSVYTGEFKYGLRHGDGKLRMSNGDYYEGQFRKGHFHGRGELKYHSKKCYRGDWVEGKKEGTGTFTWADGRSYVGGYLNDKKHGHGVYNDTKVIYKGDWENGHLHGHASVTKRKKSGETTKTYVWQYGVKCGRVRDT